MEAKWLRRHGDPRTRPTVYLLGRPVEELGFTHAVIKHAKGATPPGSYSAVNRALLVRVSTIDGEARLVGTSQTYTLGYVPGSPWWMGYGIPERHCTVQDKCCSCH